MTLQLIRNATLKLTFAEHTILVDPFFAPKHGIESFAGRERNPILDLPMDVEAIVADVDLILVTHTHADHFDASAILELPKRIPLFYQKADQAKFMEWPFEQATMIEDTVEWSGITITRTGGQHGRGPILDHMGTVSGFVLQAEGEPTIYIVGDSVWVPEAADVIKQYAPDIIVTNSGGAIMPGFEDTPILMDAMETLEVSKARPEATIIAVHLEALDHCPVSRESVKTVFAEAGRSDKLYVPEDGEAIVLKA